LVCHQSDAFGLKGVPSPIKNSDFFLEDPKRAIQNILYGQTEAIIVNGEKYHGLMPAIEINDDDLLELVNHLIEDVNAVEDRVNLKDIEWVRQNH
jgi:nitrite reductase (NO-forming)